MRIVAITNLTGGACKTTTAVNFAECLVQLGKKVLVVDTSPQADATETMGAQSKEVPTLGDLMFNGEPAENAVQHCETCDIIAAEPSLYQAEAQIKGIERYFVIKEALQPLRNNYDYIIIDSRSRLNIVLLNALLAADELVIPITAEYSAIAGLALLNDVVTEVRRYGNPDLKISGILLCRFNDRTILVKEVFDELPGITDKMQTKVYDTRIRKCEKVKEAQAKRTSLYTLAAGSTAALDYMHFALEYLRDMEQ